VFSGSGHDAALFALWSEQRPSVRPGIAATSERKALDYNVFRAA